MIKLVRLYLMFSSWFDHQSGIHPCGSVQEWDDEVATIAQRWADQCNYEHDKERSTG
jgi:hypothetical protein